MKDIKQNATVPGSNRPKWLSDQQSVTLSLT